MRARVLLSLGVALLAALAVGVPAAAGGWAVTTLDAIPTEIQAGTTYEVGYTIRQHGESPFTTDDSAIVIHSVGGQTLTFAGVPQGAAGHHVARVTFPSAGEWNWEVNQGPFAPQALGAISVVEATAAAPASSSSSDGVLSSTAMRVLLPAATAVMALLFALQFRLWRSERNRTAPATRANEPFSAGD